MSTIERLKNFNRLVYQQKMRIIQQGRCTPPLRDLHQRKGPKIVRSFQPEWYSRKEWLCGCEASSKLFCFPCLLFSKERDNVWVGPGYSDLNNLPTAITKHEQSSAHIQHQIAVKTFGKRTPISLALNEANRLQVSVHKAKVWENREILKYLIRATYFLAKQELAFRGNDESEGSSNRGNCVELLNVLAEKDE